MKIDKDGKIVYICKCGKEFDKPTSLAAHCSHCETHLGYKPKKIKKGKGNWTCSICNKIFLTKKELYTHEKEIHNLHKRAKAEGWICKICKTTFKTRAELQEHKKKEHRYHHINNQDKCKIEKTFCKYNCGKFFFYNYALQNHQNHCKLNPNKLEYKRPPMSEEQKKHLSDTAKQRYKEGKGYGWKIRTKNNPSIPEKWLIRTLENEFNLIENVHYFREYYFEHFFLDFYFPANNMVIEMDGDQHYTDIDRIKMDIKKDQLLRDSGYKELRIPWKDCCKNTKKWIQNIKLFFNDPEQLSNLNYKYINNYKRQIQLEQQKKENYALDSIGRHHPNIIKDETWIKWKNLILNSGVDLTKFGYVSKLSKITGLTKKQIRRTILKFNINHYERKAD